MRKDMSIGERIKLTLLFFLINCTCLFLIFSTVELRFSLYWFIAVGGGMFLGGSLCFYLYLFEKSEQSKSITIRNSYRPVNQQTITLVVITGAVLTNILGAILSAQYQMIIGTVLLTSLVVLLGYLTTRLW